MIAATDESTPPDIPITTVFINKSPTRLYHKILKNTNYIYSLIINLISDGNKKASLKDEIKLIIIENSKIIA